MSDWRMQGSYLEWTDWDLIQSILLLCGIEFIAELDKSTVCPSPFWISSPPSKTGPHWHILFSANGSIRSPKASFIGRPCEACAASYGR